MKCKVENCINVASARKLCKTHYNRWHRHGDPCIVRRGGSQDTKWTGGKYTNRAGYVEVWVSPNDPLRVMARKGKPYVLEHRLIMARHIGRPLTRNETIHHINGNRADNRIENLQLRSGSHGQGVVFSCADCGSTNIVSERI